MPLVGQFPLVWVEQYAEMSTEAFQIQIAEDNVPTKKNVSVHVAGIATCRISAQYEEQVNAVQNFLGKTQDEIANMIGEILRGHLRSIVGGLEVESYSVNAPNSMRVLWPSVLKNLPVWVSRF